MPSISARLHRLRTSAIARWRPRLLLRGWRQICFYSFALAGKFLRAFCRLTPRLGLKEMALWTDCAVKLARCDRELAAQFFSEGADLLLRVPAGVGRLFCAAIVARDSWYRRDFAAARYRDVFALASSEPDLPSEALSAFNSQLARIRAGAVERAMLPSALSSSTHARISGEKRVLDVEKEALLMMSEALQEAGDAYAIYGFSSSGRHRVSFYRFKEFTEPFGERVERRIGAATWLVNTRLGAAIRHATCRLNTQPSATRLLIVLSDAQPADEEYGTLRYAREDTRVALSEARATGVAPFFITFGSESNEQIESMLEGTGYTVIADVLSLPERMAGIYRRLTT